MEQYLPLVEGILEKILSPFIWSVAPEKYSAVTLHPAPLTVEEPEHPTPEWV